MAFQPGPGVILKIEEGKYQLAEHPQAPGMPYGQEDRQAVVYQLLIGDGKHYALKIFKPHFREPGLILQTPTILETLDFGKCTTGPRRS